MFTILDTNDRNTKAIANRDPAVLELYSSDCGLEFFSGLLRIQSVTWLGPWVYSIATRVVRLESGLTVFAVRVAIKDGVQAGNGFIVLFEHPSDLTAVRRYFRELGWTRPAVYLADEGIFATLGLETEVGFQDLTDVGPGDCAFVDDTLFSGVLRTLGLGHLADIRGSENEEAVYSTLYPSGYGLIHDHFDAQRLCRMTFCH